jgi:hypothetical protein
MALPKPGSRRIVVDGVVYLWRFPRRPNRSQEDGWPGVAVTVYREDNPRTSLFLAFPERFHLNGPVVQDPPRPVLPSDVAAGIRDAIVAGWGYDHQNKQFQFRVAESTIVESRQ